MSLQQQSLAYLINPLQKDDPRLAQILTLLSNQNNSSIIVINSDQQILTNFEYRFELPGVRTEGTDVYPVWKQIRLPLDGSNNTIGTGQQITRIDINAKVASASGPYIADLLVTKDKGVTFNSIFPPTNAQKLVLPQGLSWIKYGGTFALSADILQDGWWWGVDELVADGTVAGVEIIVRGVLNLV